MLNYRTVIYTGTFISGVVALTLQVVWQRYLSFLVGSEARSISLVVAVFLFGLAAGYQFWGNLTERQWTRSRLLKTVGFIELAIAAYAMAFPTWFGIVQRITYAGPDSLIFDALMTALLLVPPTFLMGASIPVLTAAVPEDSSDVNFCHSRIYGINTLGAFLGAIVAGLHFVPKIGLHLSLLAGAAASMVVGVVFIFNPLAGPGHKAQDIPRIPHAFGNWGIYAFVFTVGAVSIGMEVLFTRVVALSIGPGQYVFPIVVGVVILGLAIGSLTLRRDGLTASRVTFELIKVSVVLAILYLTAPYWPYWISHIRFSLAKIPTNYGVYLTLVVLFLCALMLPLIIPMGRLLPLGYALIDKTRSDYGKVCGRVYFCNTLGTVAGALGIGYVMFLLFDLPTIFKFCIALLLALAAVLLVRSARPRLAAACGVFATLSFLLPDWNRDSHIIGLYRGIGDQSYHFQGWFHIPHNPEVTQLLFLEDDPGATVSALEADRRFMDAGMSLHARTISVNGKSDGNTVYDYSNMALTGLLPYLHAPNRQGLKTVVVGMGTGITSGALALGQDVESVTTLEISPAVIRAGRHFNDHNFGLMSNPKSQIIEVDAFRYFARRDNRFDIIVSEPSNPWVVGVENLFTPEFYGLVGRSLNDGGVFCQWIQFYATNDEIVGAIAANLTEAFPHVSMFIVSESDIAVVASRSPLDRSHMTRRLEEAGVKRVLAPIGIDDPAIFSLLEAYQTSQLKALAGQYSGPRHRVEFPWIGHAGAKAGFLEQMFNLAQPVLEEVGRHLPATEKRRADFEDWLSRYAFQFEGVCVTTPERFASQFLCERLQALGVSYQRIHAPLRAEQLQPAITAYHQLRTQGFIQADLELLAQVETTIIAGAAADRTGALRQPLGSAAMMVIRELALEWEWNRAADSLSAFIAAGVIAPQDRQGIQSMIDQLRERASQAADLLN